MVLSSFSYSCISNNPGLTGCVSHLELVDGSVLAVLTVSRDKIHSGWRLASNPFYGNFKPNQQPYRTLVLYRDRCADKVSVEFGSLKLIEDAMAAYSNSAVLRLPGEFSERIDGDFRYIDFTLMEETFRQCGMLSSVMERTAGR
ncbi:MAG: GrdX family protein [Synergistaceae bacterium]|nr:GrdX family protein [Synergistaceae bacterium]